MDHHQQSRKQMASPDVALANEVFDQFCNATTLKSILGHFRHLCDLLKIKPTNFNQFYPKLKSKLRSWKAQALWKKFDQRANHKCYNRGKACPNTRVLIIGGGPCGMRSAIEAQLLGAKVVVVEKRDRMSRNNVLHLWPFVIQDLRALGAKKFFGKFCAGSIDHISIRQLQCILLKVGLILGVEFHENVSFEALVPPPENQEGGKIGWRAKTTPVDHPVSQYEFDVLIGADGKRNTLEGFKRKEFRGKLAIAITANFINKRTEAEARVEEISGVAFIFNQKFFKELYSETGIDLENIVYYKDDTHYFVMTAKKHSLIDKGVILQDHPDTAKLLAKENVDREALMLYAREAAEFSTEYQMMDMEFAVNHYGQPDVAMFDFTSMYAAENASRVLERRGHRLLMILVGDSLLEPFWPTGSGCARGFLSSLDACWAIKGWGSSYTPLEVIAERESIYRLLGQTTPENLNRDYAAYTLDPHTRYPNLNVRSVTSIQVRSQLDTDDPETFKLSPVQQTAIDLPKKRRRRDSQVHPDTLLHWLQRQVALYDGVRIHDMGASFKSGLAIAAIIHRYRPDLIDFHALKKDDPIACNQVAFDILEKELGIPPIMTGEEMVQCELPDKLTMFSYLTQIYEAFRGEIPHIKHPKLEPETEDRPAFSQKLSELTPEQKALLLGRIANKDVGTARGRRSRHLNDSLPLAGDKKTDTMGRRHARKRRSTEKMGATVDREPKLHAGHHRGSIDEGFSGRIKNIEEKLKGTASAEKKPKDLLRAIGKIEKTDWNVKEIEKKIEENKMGRGVRHDRVERVPKWSREQFLARQTKMEKKGREPSETDSKYADIDMTLKSIDRKIKEGNVLGHNKVSAMAEQFANKNQDAAQADQPKVQRSNSKAAVALPAQGGSEMCHFCEKRVYLMERLTAEGKSFHRGCFRCEYCSTSLRIGNHTFDRDKNGGRFYCTQHFGLPGTMKTRVEKKKVPLTNKENIPQSSNNLKGSDKGKIPLEGISGLDLLDRGQTPERIEFENLAGISDNEEAQSIMDEDEWTDRNFGPSAAEMGSSDDISDMSDSDDDNEVFEEAIDQPLTTEGTLELAKNWTLRYSHPHPTAAHSDTGSNEYEDSSNEYTSTEEDSQTATEDEEDVRARELRKKEVWLQVPPRTSDTETGSETEVKQQLSQTASNYDDSNSNTNGALLAQEPPLLTVNNDAITVDLNGSETVPCADNPVTKIEITEPSEPIVIVDSASNDSVPVAILSDMNNGSDSVASLSDANNGSNSLFSLPDANNGFNPLTILPEMNNSSNPLVSLLDVNNSSSPLVSLADANNSSSPAVSPTDANNSSIPIVSLPDVNNSSNPLVSLANANNSSSPSVSPTDANNMPIVSLPDAIPSYESESGSQLSLEVIGAFINRATSLSNLPDLITSSPKLSRTSSRLSSLSDPQSFASLEDLSFKDDSFLEKPLTVRIPTPDDAWLEVEEVLNKTEQELARPVLMVTAPTPTTERPPDNRIIESSKLAVPKEKSPVRQQEPSENPTSFDNLILELRQRKAKNKAEAQAKEALKPLATETAKLHMSKYFSTGKKNKSQTELKLKKQDSEKKELKKQDSEKREESGEEMKTVELKMKTKVSDKVEKKDILKYFGGGSFDSNSSAESKMKKAGSPVVERKVKEKSPVVEKNRRENSPVVGEIVRDELDIDILDEFTTDLEMDEIEREFREIERQNKNNLELLKSVEICEPENLFDDFVIPNSETDFADDLEALKRELNLDDKLNNNGVLKEIMSEPVIKTDSVYNNGVLKEIMPESVIKTDSVYNGSITSEKTTENYVADLIPDITSEVLRAKIDSSKRKSNGDFKTILKNPIEQVFETAIDSETLIDKDSISLENQVNTFNKMTTNNLSVKLPDIAVTSKILSEKPLEVVSSFENSNEIAAQNALPERSDKIKQSLEQANLPKKSIETLKQNNPSEETVTNSKHILSPIATPQEKPKSPSPNRPPIAVPLTKLKIERIIVKEQELLPVRIVEIKPQRLSARIDEPPKTPAIVPSDSTPKPPGRRRPSQENLSMSQPTSPVAPVRGNKSDLRKSLSVRRQRKQSGSESDTKSALGMSPVTRKKNGTAVEAKPIDSSAKQKKEKCVIS